MQDGVLLEEPLPNPKCNTCGKDLSREPVYFMCDVVMGEYCPDHWEALHCENLHNEGCATYVYQV